MRGDKACRMNVRITANQYEQVVERSKMTGKSLSDVLRGFINDGLAGSPPSRGEKVNGGKGVTASSTPVN